MLELTADERTALENTVTDQLCATLDDNSVNRLYRVITTMAVRATIATISEYEKTHKRT